MLSPIIKTLSRVPVFCLLILVSAACAAEEILVAVASNFSTTAEKLAEKFEQHSEHQVTLAFGSTGQHYAQIVSGAPFDIFLAADEERPRLLEDTGLALEGSLLAEGSLSAEGSRFTYALGQLVLWSSAQILSEEHNLLPSDAYQHLALANPRFAPYGVAAMEVLAASGLVEETRSKIVLGENVAQTFQFVESGAAQLGFVSLAQIQSLPDERKGFVWQIEPGLYSPIRQQAVLLSDDSASKEFMNFLQSEQARQLILSSGYGLEPL
jgi:molybdate transport system substrate-binding protein